MEYEWGCWNIAGAQEKGALQDQLAYAILKRHGDARNAHHRDGSPRRPKDAWAGYPTGPTRPTPRV